MNCSSLELKEELDRIATAKFNASEFFAALTSEFEWTKRRIVCICHAISSLPPFLDALEKTHEIVAILIKPKSSQPEIVRLAEGFAPTKTVSREMFSTPEAADEVFNEIGVDENTILMDIGGYFANIPLRIHENVIDVQLLGIVEDTENGHKKYEQALQISPPPLPIVSIARCGIKACEDRWVSNAIVFSAEKLMRGIGQTFHRERIAVLGYGKIGWGIATTLQSLGHTVTVYDRDPSRRLLAEAHGNETPPRETALKTSDVLFCATGNRSIESNDLPFLKDGVRIFSVTSADDEFGFSIDNLSDTDTNFSMYRWEGKVAFIANAGNAVNFLDGAHIGHYATLVQGALLHAIDEVSGAPNACDLKNLPDVRNSTIARKYFETAL